MADYIVVDIDTIQDPMILLREVYRTNLSIKEFVMSAFDDVIKMMGDFSHQIDQVVQKNADAIANLTHANASQGRQIAVLQETLANANIELGKISQAARDQSAVLVADDEPVEEVPVEQPEPEIPSENVPIEEVPVEQPEPVEEVPVEQPEPVEEVPVEQPEPEIPSENVPVEQPVENVPAPEQADMPSDQPATDSAPVSYNG